MRVPEPRMAARSDKRTRSTFRRHRLAAVALSSGVTAVLVGCNPSTNPTGEGRLEPGSQVLIATRGGRPVTTSRARPLQSGDSVEVFQGTAKVTLPDGQVLELQPRSVLVLDQGPELRSGDLLVTSPSGSAPTSPIRAAGSEVRASGATRITFVPALRVVSYQGTSTLRSGARQINVPALRTADVSLPGLLPGRPSPLTLDRADPWVGRFLREAVDGEAGLESRSRGFTSQVGARDASSPPFYSGLLPGLAAQAALQQDLVDRFGRAQPDTPVRAGEVLIGSIVALQGQRATFADRFAGAAAFRAEGASWALVAVDQQVPSIDAVLRMVDAAVNVAPLELAAPPPPPAPEPPPTRATQTARPPAPRPTTTPATTSTAGPAQPRTSTPVQAPPTTTAPAVRLDPLLDTTLDPIVALLADLLDS